MGSAAASYSGNVTAKLRLATGRELPNSKMRKFAITGLLGLLIAAAIPSTSAAQAAKSSAAAPSASSATHKSSTTGKKKKSSHHRSSRREPFQKAPTPDRISEIQTALSRGGYFEGQPNGKWDSNTISAMEKFQSANGLNSSGKIDATTLQKLGLGSSTAGVDAPKPIRKPDPTSTTSATSRSTSANNANSASTAVPTPAAASPAASKPPQR